MQDDRLAPVITDMKIAGLIKPGNDNINQYTLVQRYLLITISYKKVGRYIRTLIPDYHTLI